VTVVEFDFRRIAHELRATCGAGQRIVFISGDFNVIHPGHLRILNFAASCGDCLVVGVNSDATGNSMIPEQLRCEGVAAIGVVSKAFILRCPPEEFILELRPDIVVKGHEFIGRRNPEQEAVDSYGGKILFGSGDVRFSSKDMLRRELNEIQSFAIQKPLDFPRRHNFRLADIDRTLDAFAGLRVVIIGDLIVDEYIDCNPLGMSREDPTLVVRPILSERYVGGAGIVAAHARGLGATVSFFSVGGNDDPAQFAREKLDEYGVTTHLMCDDTRPTTLKQRFRAGGKTLLRVSHLTQNDIDAGMIERMFEAMRPALEAAHLVIFSDFNYGCLPQQLVDRIATVGQERAIRMAADSQASSQIGDVSRFRNMDLITPTEHEARLAARDSQAGLVELAEHLHVKAQAKNVIITLAEEGILIHWRDAPGGLVTDQLPAMNRAPRDFAGAGDSLLIATAMALTAGSDIWQAAYLGSVAAACQVSRKGNTPLSLAELRQELLL
jgi:rfaE bifunctional protein kinase chain/domain